MRRELHVDFEHQRTGDYLPLKDPETGETYAVDMQCVIAWLPRPGTKLVNPEHWRRGPRR